MSKAQWSISKKQFVQCSVKYKLAQADIVDELISLGNDIPMLYGWMYKNNADFGVIL